MRESYPLRRARSRECSGEHGPDEATRTSVARADVLGAGAEVAVADEDALGAARLGALARGAHRVGFRLMLGQGLKVVTLANGPRSPPFDGHDDDLRTEHSLRLQKPRER